MQTKYETKLAECLARSGMDAKQIQIMLVKFKTQASRTNERQAFLDFVDHYGNEDAQQALASIQTELERLNKSHPGVDSNPISRISSYVSRHNKWFDDIEKIGVEGISLDSSKLKIKMPSYVKVNESHAGAAHWKDKDVTLELDVCR